MSDVAILVLLYNTEPYESSTINSILGLAGHYPDAKLVIWNNGPVKFTNPDCQNLIELGYEVITEETLHNESLAVIYNRFITENAAKRYVLLDDDSVINDGYVDAAMKTPVDCVSMPVISCDGAIESPIIDNAPFSHEMAFTNKNKVMTIGSGL